MNFLGNFTKPLHESGVFTWISVDSDQERPEWTGGISLPDKISSEIPSDLSIISGAFAR
jgi:hypothetical protein